VAIKGVYRQDDLEKHDGSDEYRPVGRKSAFKYRFNLRVVSGAEASGQALLLRI
jgi:hypothetical protein